MAKTRYKIYQNEVPYFITCTFVNWLPLIMLPDISKILAKSLNFLQENKRLNIYAYVFMITHIHLVASSTDLAKELAIFKSFTARKIIDYLQEKRAEKILKLLEFYKLKYKHDRNYQVWQEGSKPKQILNEDIMRQKINYIHYNPVRSGLVDDPGHWLYSSARQYAGMEGILDITMFTI